jgi:NADH-quinone oxidoreductase subunit L
MEHPGLLYVAATLLPLASFILLLLAGALRWAVRPVRETGLGGSLYRALGGDTPQRLGAYVATSAIGLAFVLCLIGSVLFDQDPGHPASSEPVAEAHPENHAGQHASSHGVERWAGQITWSALQYAEGQPAIKLTLGYRIDNLSVIMFLMVTLVATLIHIFSIGYMADELQPVVEDHQVHTEHGHLHRRGRFGRFFLFLSLFCFSMLNLILADNLFQVFLSWELVGICSYLLIGFYYERQSASNAANKAFITNRVGDAGFILGLLILWTYVGTLNFQDIFKRIRGPAVDSDGKSLSVAMQNRFVRASLLEKQRPDDEQKLQLAKEGDQIILFAGHFHASDLKEVVEADPAPNDTGLTYMPYWLLVAAGLGIFLGCVGKSAQFPLHVWLPDAMEGPTPVSALIHAATMVAAGVYLVGRCFPLFTPEARLVIAYTGGITLFLAATIALVMTDIKKVLAYSTVSQLGYMMLGLGVGGWVAGLFHLVTHAFFKALLFLGSGSVIHGCHHEQDMMKMGGLRKKMPITAYTMLAGVLAIAGMPLFSGWYSKDAILAQAFGFTWANPWHFLLFALPLSTAFITTFYMFRMWFLTFTGEPRDEHIAEHAHESPRTMTLPLVILAFFSVVVAWSLTPLDPESSHLEHFLEHAQPDSVAADLPTEIHNARELHSLAGLLALGLVVLATGFSWLVYFARRLDPAEAAEQFPGLYRFLWNKWYFDELYSAILVRPAVAVAQWCRSFDTRVIDGAVDGTARATIRFSQGNGRFDLGIIDGLANLTARVVYACGAWLRTFQTGYLRSYVLFLVLAAIGIFFVLTYFWTLAKAG